MNFDRAERSLKSWMSSTIGSTARQSPRACSGVRSRCDSRRRLETKVTTPKESGLPARSAPGRRPKQGSQRAWPQGRATTGSLVSRQTGQLALAKTLFPQAFSWVLRQLGQVIMVFFACHGRWDKE